MTRVRWSVVTVVAGYTALAGLVFRPTLFELAHTAPAFHGIADDALLYVWAIAHVSRALFHDPSTCSTPASSIPRT